jgi:hypothetical protein
MLFYFGREEQVKIIGISEELEKELEIKLPSVGFPSFVVVDNMLVINFKKEKLTFIYNINNPKNPLFVPYPLRHKHKPINPYLGVFVGHRHIMPDGSLSHFVTNIPAIFSCLKNELQLFEFLMEREGAKP